MKEKWEERCQNGFFFNREGTLTSFFGLSGRRRLDARTGTGLLNRGRRVTLVSPAFAFDRPGVKVLDPMRRRAVVALAVAGGAEQCLDSKNGVRVAFLSGHSVSLAMRTIGNGVRA
jgi:hypothetical protein